MFAGFRLRGELAGVTSFPDIDTAGLATDFSLAARGLDVSRRRDVTADPRREWIGGIL
jgi:hypothetical protein